MMRAIQLAVACVSVLVTTAGQVQAGVITNSFGLSSPAMTITFDEFVFPQGTVVDNQYSSLGVTFSPHLYFDPQGSDPGFPNINGHNLGNFSPTINPFSINFTLPQSDAAFAMVTNSNTTTFTAFNNGAFVESFSTPTNTTSSTNFYGFTGITFDEIRVSISGDGLMLLDNIQFNNFSVSAIPEPSSIAVFVIGACIAGVGTARRRRREKKQAIAA